LSNKLTSTSVLKSTTFDARVNKLISTATLRPIVPDIRYSYIEKLKVPYRNTFVFETPLSNKLTANAVLKADRSTIRLSSFKVSAIPLKDLSYNIKTSYLSKPVTTLKQGATVFNYYNIDNTFYQSNVITNVAPTNAREVLFYSIMAPGYRTNNSIQQGKVFSPVESKITTNRLEVFDNVRFSSAPFYNVTSQSAGIRANTVLDYIYDLDIITVNTTPTNVLQISFDNTERQFTLPYPIGSYIGLTVTNHSDYFAQVLDSTFNTVTIALPEDWEAHDWIPLVIGSASPSVFPKVQVKPNGRPTTAREILFYSEMAAGFLQSRTIQDGELFGGPQDSTIRRITYLERDAWRVTEIRNSSLYSLASLIKAGAVVKGTERKGTLPGKILPRTNIKAMPFRNPFGQVERVRWGINPNYGTRFSEVIRLESFGGIIRFKTGIFNKMHDVSVKKKEPIQFWN
jgi:hypothetical protein